MTKRRLKLTAAFISLAIFLFSPAISADSADTDRKIANKLHEIDNFIRRQPETPPFAKVFERTVWSFKGTPYEGYGNDPIKKEVLEIKLDQVGCVSLMELSLAIARVAYCGQLSVAAVYKEVQKLRYRQGEIRGFESRLHYFSEWLDQATTQDIIADRTMELGGTLIQRPINYMTQRPNLYPPLKIENHRQALLQIEQDLSQRQYPYLAKEAVAAIEQQLEAGDMIAIITKQDGILVSHVAMVTLFGNERHLLHASSALKKVATTTGTVSNYLNRQDKRQGVRISKVLAPTCPLN